jgi:anti-sigma regulatory factor (Ser/Thr protein kinase)
VSHPTPGAAVPVEAFAHPALFYRGDDEYLAATSAFVRAGLAVGEPVAVSVPARNLALLRERLAEDAEAVTMLDMTQVGRNPGRIIPGVLRAFADTHPGRRVRIIGEPIWAGRTDTEYPACVQHEALINAAFVGRAATILCPYDLDGLDAVVLADAHATHPVLVDADGERASTCYDPDRIVAAYNQPLPPPGGDAVTMVFSTDTLAEVRRHTAERAVHAGLDPARIDDLVLAVNELATNSLVHGGGAGTLRVWTAGGHLVCEVSDTGRLTDPLAGRRPVPTASPGGRGLLMVNHIADLVRVHTDQHATTIRLHLAL